MEKVPFDLVSPDRLLLSTQADMIVVPGSEGDFGVLPRHSPVISTLRPGVIDVHDGGKIVERIFVASGFAEVDLDARLTVLAEEAINLKDLKRPDLEQRIKDTQEDIADAKDGIFKLKSQGKLDQLKTLLAALG